MPDTQIPSPPRPLPLNAAIDAVGALRNSLDALLAVEELLEVAPNQRPPSIGREKVGSLVSLIATRFFLDLKDAEASLLAAVHHCKRGD